MSLTPRIDDIESRLDVLENNYLEAVYQDSTGNINSPSTYVSPGPSEFDLTLPAGTWEVGYSVSIALESLGGNGDCEMSSALHLDGVLVADTEAYGKLKASASTGGIITLSNKVEITLVTSQDLQLKFQSYQSVANLRTRMVSTGWTVNMNGLETAPKIWARRVK